MKYSIIEKILSATNVDDLKKITELINKLNLPVVKFEIKLILSGPKFNYKLSAVKGEGEDYLGAILEAKKPNSGETWLRQNDLHDGKLDQNTMDGILKDIEYHEENS